MWPARVYLCWLTTWATNPKIRNQIKKWKRGSSLPNSKIFEKSEIWEKYMYTNENQEGIIFFSINSIRNNRHFKLSLRK